MDPGLLRWAITAQTKIKAIPLHAIISIMESLLKSIIFDDSNTANSQWNGSVFSLNKIRS